MDNGNDKQEEADTLLHDATSYNKRLYKIPITFTEKSVINLNGEREKTDKYTE